MKTKTKMAFALISALICLLPALPVMADVLADTSWNTSLTIKAKAKGVGSYTIQEGYQIDFNADNTFKATASDDGNYFNGTYLVTSNGKVVSTLDEAQLQNYLAAEIVNAAAEQGVVVSNPWIGNFEIKDLSTVKEKKGTLSYTMKIKIAFDLTATVDGDTQNTSGSFMIGGKHTQSRPETDELYGAAFGLEVVEKISASSLGSVKDDWFLDIYFGPNSTYGLQPGEFIAQNGSVQVRGTYKRSGNKGNIDLQINPDDVAAIAKDKFEEAAATYYVIEDLNIDLINQKFYGALKKGIFSLNAQVVYSYSALVNGEQKSGTGKYNIKGSGPLLD